MENAIWGIKKKANIWWSGDSDFSAAEFPHFFIKRRHSRLIVCIWGLSILDGNYLSSNRIILVSPSVSGYLLSFILFLQWMNFLSECVSGNNDRVWLLEGGGEEAETSVQPWKWSLHHLLKWGGPRWIDGWMDGWMDGWIDERKKQKSGWYFNGLFD